MLGDIDYSLSLPIPEMWLALPDRTLVAKLNNKSGLGFSRFGKKKKLIKHTQLYKVNNINEIEFTIPFVVEINHEEVRNTVVDQIKESSLIKTIHNGYEEWFVIIDIKRSMDASMDTMTLQCRSLGYELMRQNIRNFKVIAQNLTSLMNGGTSLDTNGNSFSYNGLLSNTLWTLDSSHDTTFDTLFRDIDISKATILNAIMTVAKTFNAIISFDTINRKINFQQLQNIGHDKDARITYESYMKSLENESKIDILATRIVPSGKNNLTIASVSPNGGIGIDDYSFFTDGFTRDINKNVLTHSNQNMSDSLCGALLDYSALLVSKNGQYTTLLTTLTGYRTTLTTKQNEMAALTATLVSIQHQLDLAQTTGQPTATLLSQQTSQNALIATKQSEINGVNANITSTLASITTLQATLSTSANFTNAQVQELIPYIRSVDWEDLNISDAQDLYNQALIQFVKYKTPTITIKVDMVNIFESVSEQRVWDKFWIGNDVLVEYNAIGTSVKAKILEMSFDHVEGNLALTISSVSDLIRSQEAAFNMLYQGVSAANTLSVNVDNWNGIDAVAANVNAIYNNGIDSAKIAINAGASNTIVINNRGLTSTTSTNVNSLIRINNGVLGFSGDGGNTFSTAIWSGGINAAVITGQLGQFVTLSASQITTGSLVGINMQIGTSPNLFLANISGISLGATTWAAAPFRVDMLGNAWATSMTLTTPSITNGSIVGTTITIGSGSSIFKADTNGIYLGNSVFASAPFRVSPAGVATMTGANISGNITMTSGSISWGSVSAPSPAQVGAVANNQTSVFNTLTNNGALAGLFMSGGQLYINASYLNAGTITGINITGTNITGTSTITGATIKTGANGTSHIEITGGGLKGITSDGLLSGLVYNPTPTDIVDIAIYHRGGRLLEFYDSGTDITIQPASGANWMNIGINGKTTYAHGTWDFSGASVTGVTATLG